MNVTAVASQTRHFVFNYLPAIPFEFGIGAGQLFSPNVDRGNFTSIYRPQIDISTYTSFLIIPHKFTRAVDTNSITMRK